MCGICGSVDLVGGGEERRSVVRAMTDTMRHRGPDDAGYYFDRRAALGHRRLSIIDVSGGRQPIGNEDGTIWIVFNGEIYNYRELRGHLIGRGHRLTTSTDTEVVVHLYEEYGDECVSRLDGMFAFALWDSKQCRLLLARDRVGIKPLYYVATRGRLLFASELKAVLADPECPREIEPAAIDRFFTFHYTPGIQTPFRGICKLAPGHYLVAAKGGVTVRRYWDLAFPVTPRKIGFDQAKAELTDLLDRTVKAHMISDVPVGVLLSGGVDSSGVLSFAAQHADGKLRTFTVGFEAEEADDERPYARIAAQRFGAEHHEITVGPEQFKAFLPSYVWHMEELVCEPPAIALHFVTRLAHDNGVKVVLSGEGGDEAFAGYHTYRNLLRLERIKGLPAPLPYAAAALAAAAGRIMGDHRLSRAAAYLRTPLDQAYFSRTASPESYFHCIKDHLYTPELRAAVRVAATEKLDALFATVQRASPLSRMLYVDTKTWLPDDLLIKADKITMANSVELRVPILDHHVLEFAAGLPDEYKIRGGRAKYILKESLRERVPRELLDRKKAGFPVPAGRWLRGELFRFASDILTDPRSRARGYVRPVAVDNILAEHQSTGRRTAELFSLLVLELWHRQFADCPRPVHA